MTREDELTVLEDLLEECGLTAEYKKFREDYMPLFDGLYDKIAAAKATIIWHVRRSKKQLEEEKR